MATSEIRGHCLCGRTTYLVDKAPAWCGHCHCSSCRRQTGSALATFVGCERAHFTLTGEEMGCYESSPGVRRYFCQHCGTPIAYESRQLPGEIHLFLGSLDNPQDYVPGGEVFCGERLPWLKVEVAGPSFDGLPET